MKNLKLTIGGLLIAVGLFAAPLAPVANASIKDQLNSGADATTSEDDRSITLQDQIRNVTNVLLYVIGAVAVIVIIFGGIKFITADGDASKVKGARDTILYAVVGIVVAIIAYAVVQWAIDAFTS